MLDLHTQSDEELELIRRALMEREGLVVSLFDLLRRVPRRVLMILKLNDLTRSELSQPIISPYTNCALFLETSTTR